MGQISLTKTATESATIGNRDKSKDKKKRGARLSFLFGVVLRNKVSNKNFTSQHRMLGSVHYKKRAGHVTRPVAGSLFRQKKNLFSQPRPFTHSLNGSKSESIYFEVAVMLGKIQQKHIDFFALPPVGKFKKNKH